MIGKVWNARNLPDDAPRRNTTARDEVEPVPGRPLPAMFSASSASWRVTHGHEETLALWRGIGLEELCERLLPPGQERISWAKMAAVLVAARFCEPSSELHIAEDWYRRTALCDLLQLESLYAPLLRAGT